MKTGQITRRVRLWRSPLLATGLACAALATAAAPAGAAARPATGPGTIATIVGGVGGPAIATRVSLASVFSGNNFFDGACGVTPAGGSLYVGNVTSVRKINTRTGGLTTPVGDGLLGFYGDHEPATSTGLPDTCSVAVNQRTGLIALADGGLHQILVVPASSGSYYGQAMTAGNIYTVAGNGLGGFSRTGVPATQTGMLPVGLTMDSHGNLLLAVSGFSTRTEQVGGRILVVAAATGTFYHRPMTAGDLYALAGSRHGTMFSGDGGPAIQAGLTESVGYIRTDSSGNLLLADLGANRVRVVAEKTGTFYGQAMTRGDIYTVAGDGQPGFSGDGGLATSAGVAPRDVAVDAAGNLVIADETNQRIRVVAARTGTFYGQDMTAGDIYTVAGDGVQGFSGDGGPASSASLSFPSSAAADSAGNLVIGDAGNNRVRVTAASTGTFYGQAMMAGDIYTVAGDNGVLRPPSGDGRPATSEQLSSPADVTTDQSGNVLVADTFDNQVQVRAESTGTFYGRSMTAGDMYTLAGTGQAGSAGDGGPAAQAELWEPAGVAVDPAGNVVIADFSNARIRVVATSTGTFFGQDMTAGDIYTIATGVNADHLAVDQWGNIVLAASVVDEVRVLAASTGTFYGLAMTAGHIYTIAGDGVGGYSGDGGPATAAELYIPEGVAVDAAGNVVIADMANNRIRLVAASTGTYYGISMTAGDIYTVAGDGVGGYSGDGGPATSAEFNNPEAVAVDGAGNLLIADTQNGLVRVVAESTGSYYGVSMTAGDIYLVAGGAPVSLGDGGPGTSARLGETRGVAPGPAGSLLIADSGDNRVREVAG